MSRPRAVAEIVVLFILDSARILLSCKGVKHRIENMKTRLKLSLLELEEEILDWRNSQTCEGGTR